jgi:hypothetical protein
MRKPNESLDDFLNNYAILDPAEPPPAVSLEPSGEIEVLKPLARWEGFVDAKAVAAAIASADTPREPRFSWFHRSLAVVGSFAVIALVLGTGVYTGIFGPPVEFENGLHEVAVNDETEETPTPSTESEISDLLTSERSTVVFDGTPKERAVARPRNMVRPRVLFTSFRTRRPRIHPQFIVSEFVPTTLIIFAENGEIKSRIEAQPITTDKKRKPA